MSESFINGKDLFSLTATAILELDFKRVILSTKLHLLTHNWLNNLDSLQGLLTLFHLLSAAFTGVDSLIKSTESG